MPFEISAYQALTIATWTFAVATLLAVGILGLRYRQRRDERISKVVTDRWHPLLSLASFGMSPEQLPPLHRQERVPFLKLWVYLQTSLRGDARNALSDIARELSFDTIVMRMLERGSRADKLLAIVVAGHLSLRPAMPLLSRYAASNDSILSLQAMHAAIRISPEVAVQLLTLCIGRADWPVSQLLPSLRELGLLASGPLREGLNSPHEAEVSRTIALIGGLRLPTDLALQQQLLACASPRLLSESLALVDQPALLPDVRSLLPHADNRVRTSAVEVIARMGGAGDMDALANLLGDRSWKVRNAAARAIAALPAGGIQALGQLAASCDDRYGRSMAEHVLAEIRLATPQPWRP